MNKKNVLFVGSFKSQATKGAVGGQMYACTSLVESSLSNDINWIKIDTTALSNMHIPFHNRLFKAIKRLFLFIYYLLFKKVDAVLIFAADGFSFIEKGLMAIIAKSIFFKKVIFAPRSGITITELDGKWLKFTKAVFKKTDHVICQGETWKKIFSKKVTDNKDSRYIVIKNWIDTTLYRRGTNPEKNISILFLASLEKDKGIFDFLNVLHNIIDKGTTNITVTIAGKGKEEEKAHEMVKELGLSEYVNFKGWVLGKDKIALLSTSDIFTLPSYFEGSPNSLIEAMASGIPSIATDVGAIPDIINDGQNGFIFPLGNLTKFQKDLETLIQNETLRNQMGTNAIDYIKNNHDINIAIKKFKEILN